VIVECRSESEAGQALDVLCEAFHDYPVMRYVIGPAGEEYDRRLRSVIEFFLQARLSRNEPVLGIADGETLVAAAIVTLPGSGPLPAALAARRELVWAELGADALARYEAYGAATRPLLID
jgi:hypothetical protein